MIEAESVSKTYQLPRGRTLDAVREVSFTVPPGTIYGLLGPNGAGKTTLLRMLATILSPTSGRCIVAGADTVKNPQEARRRIGFLSGNTRLYGRLSPAEILRYFGRLYGMDDASIATRTEELASALGMADILGRRCEGLSTGQSQKTNIARVLVHDPPVLILDEPTLGLDIMTSRAILDFISESRTRGRTVLFSTHYMTEAEQLCDRIGLIHKGLLLAEGSKEELYARTDARNLQDAFLRLVADSDGGLLE